MYDATGPKVAHAACLLPDGRRTWANNFDLDTMDEMTRVEFCNTSVSLNRDGIFSV